MKRIVIFTICLIAVLFCCISCRSVRPDNTVDDPVTNEAETTARNNHLDVETYTVETRYCNLKYPAKWEGKVKTEIFDNYGYIVKFIADDVSLFDFEFVEGNGVLLGTLVTDSENVVIKITSYDLEHEMQDYDIYAEMQSDIDVIIENLMADYTLELDEIIEPEEESVFEIKSSLVALYYPTKWKESILVETSENRVKFSCNSVPLFDIVFGDNENVSPLGYYKDIAVSVTTHDISSDFYTDSEYVYLRAMQEDVDVVIEGLLSDENFILN